MKSTIGKETDDLNNCEEHSIHRFLQGTRQGETCQRLTFTDLTVLCYGVNLSHHLRRLHQVIGDICMTAEMRTDLVSVTRPCKR